MSDKIYKLAMDEATSTDLIQSELETIYGQSARLESQPIPFEWMDQVLVDYVEHIEAISNSEGGIVGIPTGLSDYDDLIDGILPKTLTILAGRPGMGKTALLMTIALNLAKRYAPRRRYGEWLYIWSGEMSVEQLRERVTSSETGINGRKLRRGVRRDGSGMTQGEWSGFMRHLGGDFGKLPIALDTTPGITPLRLESNIARATREMGRPPSLIMVDYIGLMTGVGDFKGNRVLEISDITKRLKEIATHICPIYAASQLNRGVESRQDKHPVMSDLRDSGSQEQDADVIAMLYRDVVYNEATEHPTLAEIEVVKNRHGGTGTVYTHFEKAITKFTDAKTQTIDLRELYSAWEDEVLP